MHKTDSTLYLPSVGGHQVVSVLVWPSKYAHRPKEKTPAESSAEYTDETGYWNSWSSPMGTHCRKIAVKVSIDQMF